MAARERHIRRRDGFTHALVWYASFVWAASTGCATISVGTPNAVVHPVVEVEDSVTTFLPPNNGAGPLWCHGAPLLVRHGADVFLSTMETGTGVPLLCNSRWLLWRRDAAGWRVVQRESRFEEREPCPLVGFDDGRLLLSINPTTQPPGTMYGPCDPRLLAFDASYPERPGIPIAPVWEPGAKFTDHSYRGIAVDAARGEILVLNIDSVSGQQFWSFRDSSGAWGRQGRIAFPIRACYPEVALRGGAAHVLALGDVLEPNDAWRAFKQQTTGTAAVYVFRRLFYSWTPDIAGVGFTAPVEVDNADTTAGAITNLDLWIDAAGAAHLIYMKEAVESEPMREKFFSRVPLRARLEYRVMDRGGMTASAVLYQGGDAASGVTPLYARLQATVDGRLFAIYADYRREPSGQVVTENWLLQVEPNPGQNSPVKLDLREPMRAFFTATERGGSPPSSTIDMYGVGKVGTTLRYARIRF